MVYAVSFESDDHTGTAWIEVEGADDSLAALCAAAEMFGDEYGQPGKRTAAEAFPVSVPVELSPGEVGACGNCSKPIPAGFAVCSKECAAEANEGLSGDDRIMRHDYPSMKGGMWRPCWRASEGGFRACYLGRDTLYTPERGGDPYDEQRPQVYDDRLYPAEAPARGRVEALNGVKV